MTQHGANSSSVDDGPVHVADVSLDEWPQLPDLMAPPACTRGHVTFRLNGVPVGTVEVPTRRGCIAAPDLRTGAVVHAADAMLRQLVATALQRGLSPADLSPEALLRQRRPAIERQWPHVTAAVCTRGRPDDLPRCLESLARVDYPSVDLLVVDNNAPSDRTVVDLVAGRFPSVRCIREPRPGLDWARNRAVLEATGDIVAFTDDDAVVDASWLRALVAPFLGQADVNATAGLVLPLELDTSAQQQFERHGGLGRGFSRRWLRMPYGSSPTRVGNITTFGTGASMAFRRSALTALGGFDPALDAGTASAAGGDTEIFFRVLKAGGTMVYEPGAVARHRHRRDVDAVAAQLRGWLTGVHCAVASLARRYPDERVALLGFAARLLGLHYPRRLVSAYLGSGLVPSLVVSELKGALTGFGRYRAAERAAEALTLEYPGEPTLSAAPIDGTHARRLASVRTVTLPAHRALPEVLDGPDEADWVRVHLAVRGQSMTVPIVSGGWPVTRWRLADAIAATMGHRLVDAAAFRDALGRPA